LGLSILSQLVRDRSYLLAIWSQTAATLNMRPRFKSDLKETCHDPLSND
jgi:hypothetical protein